VGVKEIDWKGLNSSKTPRQIHRCETGTPGKRVKINLEERNGSKKEKMRRKALGKNFRGKK